jgi:hypothetical protein
MAIRQGLTPTKAQKVGFSLQKIAIIAKVLMFESMSELDCDFRMPKLNNFAKRIKSDCEAIDKELRCSGWYDLSYTEKTEEYSGEVWRLIDLLARLDVENTRALANSLEEEFNKLEEIQA